MSHADSSIIASRGTKRSLSIAALFLLSGCAINALRTEYAKDVASTGSVVAVASSEFLHRVDTTRRLANVEMVVADPTCGRTPAIVRGPILIQQLKPGWLCVPSGAAVGAGDRSFSLTPIAPELQPTLELVGALSSYAEALAEVVDAKPSDPTKPLLDALTTARSAEGLLLALKVRETGATPAADDPRLKAVQGLVTFLGELSDEAHKVSELRKIIAANPLGALPTINALRDHLLTWENSRKADEAIRVVVTGALLRRSVDASPPVAPDARRKAITTFYELQDASRVAAKIHPALMVALDELEKADADLRRILVENPKLTAKERAKIAELNRQRVVRALNLITALITSFRGA